MSKRNGEVTDAYDHTHRRLFVDRLVSDGKATRQRARYIWARLARGHGDFRFRGVYDATSRKLISA